MLLNFVFNLFKNILFSILWHINMTYSFGCFSGRELGHWPIFQTSRESEYCSGRFCIIAKNNSNNRGTIWGIPCAISVLSTYTYHSLHYNTTIDEAITSPNFQMMKQAERRLKHCLKLHLKSVPQKTHFKTCISLTTLRCILFYLYENV